MTKNHTPSPWYLDCEHHSRAEPAGRKGLRVYKGSFDDPICIIPDRVRAEGDREVDARIIRAAGEMYEMLCLFSKRWEMEPAGREFPCAAFRGDLLKLLARIERGDD